MVTGSKKFKAEQSATQYLEMRGFELIEINFKRSRYSIDLIASKKGEIYFLKLEIQSLSSQSFDMLTPSQIAQMRLAAASWIKENEWKGNIHYSIIEVDSDSFAIMNFNEDFL